MRSRSARIRESSPPRKTGLDPADLCSFHAFFGQIDQFKSNHFLWLTAGGVSVAEISKGEGKAQEDVDRELGDEDEDPEGGEV